MSLISVIIPCYNVAKYIERCVVSVLNQTYKNWEIIAIDDGSSDNTWNELLKLNKLDERIKIYKQMNQGVVTTRINAVNISHGEYLFFLDGDDFLPKDALEILISSIIKSNSDLVVGSYTLVWEGSNRSKLVNNLKNFVTPEECMLYILNYGETFLPIKLYKRNLFLSSVNIPIDLCIQEDTIGVIQYLLNSKSVSYTERSVYFYWKHSGTASSVFTFQHCRSLLKVSSLLIQLISKLPLLHAVMAKVCVANIYSCLNYGKLTKEEKIAIEKMLYNINTIDISSIDKKYILMRNLCNLYLSYPKLGYVMIRFNCKITALITIIKRQICSILK